MHLLLACLAQHYFKIYRKMLVKILCRHGNSEFCIAGNLYCFTFLKMFHLSSRRLLRFIESFHRAHRYCPLIKKLKQVHLPTISALIIYKDISLLLAHVFMGNNCVCRGSESDCRTITDHSKII